KYKKLDELVFESILKKIVAYNQSAESIFSLSHNFFSDYSSEITDTALLKVAYLQQARKGESFHFDFDGKELFTLLERDSAFLLEYLEEVYGNSHHVSIHSSHPRLSIIWALENHMTLLEESLDFIAKTDPYPLLGECFFNAFFEHMTPDQKEKAHNFLLSNVDRYAHEAVKVGILFNVVANSTNEIFESCFNIYLKKNQSLEDFKSIDWFKSGGIGHGATIFGDINAAKWTKLLNLVENLDLGFKTIPITSYIESRIDSEKQFADNERRRMFLHPRW
ncbi:MAG: hypothetical protein RIB86_26350, partial [Imperialibacter sp.]